MEEKILALLESLKAGQADLNRRIDALQADMNKRFDIVDADMKTLRDFALDAEEANEKRHKEIFKRLDEVASATQTNSYDIAVLKGKAV